MRVRTSVCAAVLLAAGAGSSQTLEWTDPAGDQFDTASPPELDLVRIRAEFAPGLVRLTLSFAPAPGITAHLEELSGFVDFDIDPGEGTGRESHIESFGFEPAADIGVDYFLEFWPYAGMAELVYVEDHVEYSVDLFPVTVSGADVTVELPRCELTPLDGLCIQARFDLVALVGNLWGPTDRAPNDDSVFSAFPHPADFDGDGDVDDDDLAFMRSCVSGPAIPQNDPACRAADLDGDGDVDQDDFALLQAAMTGPY